MTNAIYRLIEKNEDSKKGFYMLGSGATREEAIEEFLMFAMKAPIHMEAAISSQKRGIYLQKLIPGQAIELEEKMELIAVVS